MQGAMVSSGALLKTGSVCLAFFKLNPKSQSIGVGRECMCLRGAVEGDGRRESL